MTTSNKRLSCSDYHVAWICPVADVELLPARLMLDEEHHVPVYNTQYDHNTYICGSINNHTVVIATCPQGKTGNVNAGHLAGFMFKTFPNIRMAVLVGIGGGIPSPVVSEDPLKNIHLGDVVVGWPGDGKPACVYHDQGRSKGGAQFELVGTMGDPDWRVISALSILASDVELDVTRFQDQLARLQQPRAKGKFSRPGHEHDMLFEASYRHTGDYNSKCTTCNHSKIITRPTRTADDQNRLVFHRGRIATGTAVIQDGELRDRIRARCEGALCVEMEAAGVDVNRSCLVIRGISDYADSHKNDIWRSYAAGNAAAFTRELLRKIKPATVRNSDGMCEELVAPKTPHPGGACTDMQFKAKPISGFVVEPPEKIASRWMASFSLSGYDERFQRLVNERYPYTCEWVPSCNGVLPWRTQRWPSILWISGISGSGKSVALASLVSDLPSYQPMHQSGEGSALVHAFCDDRLNNTASSVLSVIIHQLLLQFPGAIDSVCDFDRGHYMVPTPFAQWIPKPGSTRPAVQLWNILRQIVKQARLGTLFLVIDALDECDRESQSKLFQLFHESVNGDSGLKVLFSSQTNSELESLHSRHSMQAPKAWRHEKMEHFENDINNDIEIYIRGEIARIATLRYLSDKEQEQIRGRLLSERSGIFLPAVFLLRELEVRNCWSFEQILDSIPPNLGSLYGKLFQHLSHIVQPVQKRTLKYLAYSIGDITPRDIAYACYTLEDSQLDYIAPIKSSYENHLNETRRHLDCMRTVVRFRGESAPVSFIHKTAKEYLTTLSGNRATSRILPKPHIAHTDIAVTCLALVCATVDFRSQLILPDGFSDARVHQERIAAIENIPFLEYALRNWYSHLKQAIENTPEDKKISPLLFQKIVNFVKVWNQDYPGIRYTLIRYSSMGELARNGAKISILEVFSGFGLTRCLKMLLEEYPDRFRSINAQVRRAVLFAVRSGHESAFDLLVDHFKIKSLDGTEYKEIITSSAWSGHFGVLEKIMRLRDPTLEEFVGATLAAFSTGDYHVLNRIKADGAIFDNIDKNERTALHLLFVGAMTSFAIVDNNTDVSEALILAQVDFYIKYGVNINAQDRCGFTALHYACHAPQLCKRDLLIGLITRGANPMLTTKGGLTPLHLAVRFARQPSAVQVLLDVTCNKLASMQSLGGNTALHWAVQRQSIRIEQQHHVIALENSMETMPALPGIHDIKDYRRQYSWETHSPSSIILQLLLAAGADPDTRNKHGSSPLDRVRHREVGSVLEWGHAHPDSVSAFVTAFRQLHATPKSVIRICNQSMGGVLPKALLPSIDSEGEPYPGVPPLPSNTTGTFYTAIQTDESDTSRKVQKKEMWKSWSRKEDIAKDGLGKLHW